MNQESPATNSSDLNRRLIRMLGSQPAHASDPEGTASAARLLYDRLRRLDSSVRWFDSSGHSPLVVAGSGPQLLVCYLDDADPYAAAHTGAPPTFKRGAISSPGIARKAGVIAAVSRHVLDREEGLWTLAIETDRHTGSSALREWLTTIEHPPAVGIWEATDFPIERPAVIRGANGRLHLTVTVALDHGRTETPFGGVVPDVGHQLSGAIAELMTQDHEVRLENFYDDIISPDDDELAAISTLGDGISNWLARVAPGATSLPGRHLAMGIFLTPSLIVRNLSLEGATPYLPTRARVRLELQILPGQSPARIRDSLADHFRERIPSVQIETELLQQPVLSALPVEEFRRQFDLVLPATPGWSPASLLEEAGIATIGYTAIGRSPNSGAGGVTLEQIAGGAEHIRTIGEAARTAVEQAPR